MAIIDRILGLNQKPFELDNPKEYEDCASCRVVGSTALVSLGFYTGYSGMQQLRVRRNIIEHSRSKYKTGSRQLGIISLSASLIGLGIYRMLN